MVGCYICNANNANAKAALVPRVHADGPNGGRAHMDIRIEMYIVESLERNPKGIMIRATSLFSQTIPWVRSSGDQILSITKRSLSNPVSVHPRGVIHVTMLPRALFQPTFSLVIAKKAKGKETAAKEKGRHPPLTCFSLFPSFFT